MLALVLVSGISASPLTAQDEVRVEQTEAGCSVREERGKQSREHVWVRKGNEFRWADRALSAQEMAALRDAVLNARTEVPELLFEVGVTPEALAAHRDAIVAVAMPEAFREKRDVDPALVAAELDRLLAWDRVAPLVRNEMLGNWWVSTQSRLVRVTFVDRDREVVVESRGLVPWMLPWKVTIDGRSFTSEDLAIPRAVRTLLDPSGPCVGALDGGAYWSEEFWSNNSFWTRFVGDELNRSLSAERYTQLPGWSRASELFTVSEVRTGNINLQPESMYFELESKLPAAIDGVRWHDFLVNGEPAQSWDDFLDIHARAAACVEQQRWLLEWKALDPSRRILLDAAGKHGYAEDMLDELVMPAWEHAGFAGRPEFEISLQEGKAWVGTIYLASGVPGALIETAHPERLDERSPKRAAVTANEPVRHHWFDDLCFSYHPRDYPPTYGLVDAAGRVAVRTTPRADDR